MKKLFLIIIAVVSIFTCVSCSSDGFSETTKTTKKNTDKFIILDSCSVKDPNYNSIIDCKIIVDTEIGTMYLFASDSRGCGGLTEMVDRGGYTLVWDGYKK